MAERIVKIEDLEDFIGGTFTEIGPASRLVAKGVALEYATMKRDLLSESPDNDSKYESALWALALGQVKGQPEGQQNWDRIKGMLINDAVSITFRAGGLAVGDPVNWSHPEIPKGLLFLALSLPQ